MGVAEKMWDGITTVITMNGKVESMAATIKEQQQKLESLTERVIRLETALEIGLSRPTPPDGPRGRRLTRKS